MSENELIAAWFRVRRDVIFAQLAPTALLGFTLWLMLQGLADADLPTRVAASGILFASGILGALAQFSLASEAEAIGRELGTGGSSAVASRIASSARWLWVVKFVTPGVFVAIFVALMVALFT